MAKDQIFETVFVQFGTVKISINANYAKGAMLRRSVTF